MECLYLTRRQLYDLEGLAQTLRQWADDIERKTGGGLHHREPIPPAWYDKCKELENILYIQKQEQQ